MPARHAPHIAFGQQHLNNVFCRAVAKKLAFVLFMKRDLVTLHQSQEVPRGVARQGRATKARVVTQEVGGARVQVGEIAAPTT